MINPEHPLPVKRQFACLGLSRSTHYRRTTGPSPHRLRLLEAVKALNREHPSMGARRLSHQLKCLGLTCDRWLVADGRGGLAS